MITLYEILVWSVWHAGFSVNIHKKLKYSLHLVASTDLFSMFDMELLYPIAVCGAVF